MGYPSPQVCLERVVCPTPTPSLVNRQTLLKTFPSLAVVKKTSGNVYRPGVTVAGEYVNCKLLETMETEQITRVQVRRRVKLIKAEKQRNNRQIKHLQSE